MQEDGLYLRPNAVGEPLVDQWYAWTHLISPATAARNITHRHLKIMDSYLAAPYLHAAAVKDQALVGGPFMDYDRNRVEEVKALRQKTVRSRANMVALSQALDELDGLLASKGDGYSLEALYPEIPGRLQGYVELIYDLNSHPSFRLIEPLLYRSEYFDTSCQSMFFSLLHQDDRPFMLSTPRLLDETGVHLPMSFAHPGIDLLFSMERKPRRFAEVKDALGFEDAMDGEFRKFLTPQPPSRYQRHEGRGVRWRYFGHACILVETAGFNVLLDPVLSYTYESSISRYTYEDLPDVIDYVLITHNHQDHVLIETLLRLRHKIRHVVVPRNGNGALEDPSLKLLLESMGFANVVECREMEEIRTADGSLTGVPFLGEHGDLNVQTKMAWLVNAGGHRLLFAADSCNISPALYRHVHRQVGDVDVLFLGMECDGAPLSWIYGPLLLRPLDRAKDHSRRLAGSNYERAMDMVNTVRCKEVYVYAMGQEPWLNHVMPKKYTEDSNPIVASNRLIDECRTRGIRAGRLFGEKEILC